MALEDSSFSLSDNQRPHCAFRHSSEQGEMNKLPCHRSSRRAGGAESQRNVPAPRSEPMWRCVLQPLRAPTGASSQPLGKGGSPRPRGPEGEPLLWSCHAASEHGVDTGSEIRNMLCSVTELTSHSLGSEPESPR